MRNNTDDSETHYLLTLRENVCFKLGIVRTSSKFSTISRLADLREIERIELVVSNHWPIDQEKDCKSDYTKETEDGTRSNHLPNTDKT